MTTFIYSPRDTCEHESGRGQSDRETVTGTLGIGGTRELNLRIANKETVEARRNESSSKARNYNALRKALSNSVILQHDFICATTLRDLMRQHFATWRR